MNSKNRIIKYALICFCVMFFFSLLIAFSHKVSIGFFGHIALLISGTFFTTAGAFVGDLFRRFVMPDAYLTTGAIDTFQKKIFWSVGPQCIGWFIGLLACNGFMKSVVGIPGLFG